MPKKVNVSQHSPFRDLLGFILLAVAVFVLISLITYSPSDPSLHTRVVGDDGAVHNYGGIVGSHLADVLMQLFGFASYLFFVALVASAFLVVFAKSNVHLVAQISSFFLLLISAALLSAMVEGETRHIPSWGGVIGYYLKGVSVTYLGLFGSYLSISLLVIATLVLNFRLSRSKFHSSEIKNIEPLRLRH